MLLPQVTLNVRRARRPPSRPRVGRAWAPVQPFLAAPPRVDHFEERPNLGLRGPGVVTDLSWAAD